MFSSRLLFSRHCAFPAQYQSYLQFSSTSLTSSSSQQPQQSATPKSPTSSCSDEPSDASLPQRKPGFLKRLDQRLEERRHSIEHDLLSKNSSRLTPEMKQRFDDFQNMDKRLKERENL